MLYDAIDYEDADMKERFMVGIEETDPDRYQIDKVGNHFKKIHNLIRLKDKQFFTDEKW